MELAALEPATSWVQFRSCSVTRLLEMRVRVRTVFARMTAALALPGRKPCKSREPTPGLEPGTPSLRVSGRSHHQSPQVMLRAGSPRQEVTHADSR
jgi:hypothetical protein